MGFLLVPSLIAAIWAVTISAIALPGWSRLARHYRAAGPPPAVLFRFRSAQIGWINYSGGLTFGVGADGLTLAVWFPFRFNHPTLYFPWADVTATPGRSFWNGKYLELQPRLVPGTPIRVSARFGERIASAANRTWDAEAEGTEE